MATGGYQLVDFKKVNLTSGTKNTTLTECYAAIEGTRKRTVVTGLVVGGTEYHDFEAVFTASGQTYNAEIVLADSGSISITVETTGVTVTVA